MRDPGGRRKHCIFFLFLITCSYFGDGTRTRGRFAGRRIGVGWNTPSSIILCSTSPRFPLIRPNHCTEKFKDSMHVQVGVPSRAWYTTDLIQRNATLTPVRCLLDNCKLAYNFCHPYHGKALQMALCPWLRVGSSSTVLDDSSSKIHAVLVPSSCCEPEGSPMDTSMGQNVGIAHLRLIAMHAPWLLCLM
jgi:hypothetical protein